MKSKHRSAADLNHQAKFPQKKIKFAVLQSFADDYSSRNYKFIMQYLNIQGRLGIFKVDSAKNETYRFPRLVKSFRNPSLVIISTNSSKSSLLSWFWSNRS